MASEVCDGTVGAAGAVGAAGGGGGGDGEVDTGFSLALSFSFSLSLPLDLAAFFCAVLLLDPVSSTSAGWVVSDCAGCAGAGSALEDSEAEGVAVEGFV